MLRYFGRILAMPAERLPRRVYELLREEGRRRSWTGVVERLAREWGLADVWEAQRLPQSRAADDADAWKRLLKVRAQRMALANHRDEVNARRSAVANQYAAWSHMGAGATQMRMADYVRAAGVEDAGVAELFALRSGTSNLRADQGWRLRIARADCCCLMCGQGVEDARHVLVHCPAHEEARRSLRSKLPPYLQDLASPEVLSALMQSAELERRCGNDDAMRRAVAGAVKAFFLRTRRRREAAGMATTLSGRRWRRPGGARTTRSR